MKSIQCLRDYELVLQAVESAEGNFGDGETGIHYSLTFILIGYDIWPPHNSKKELVKKAKELLQRYEKENFS